MEEMRIYIEKRINDRETEPVGAWFTPPIDYDALAERICVTDYEPDYVIRNYELPFDIDENMMIEEINCLCQLAEEMPDCVQRNMRTLLKDYGDVRNLYQHAAEIAQQMKAGTLKFPK